MLRELVLETPPNVVEGGWRTALPELLRAARIGGRLSKLDMPHAARPARLCSRSSAGDYLDGWFESDPIKAVFGFDGIVGNYASPYTPGSAYVLLHHVFGEVNGKKGAWGHAIGGMGAITQAMAKAAAARGVDIRVNAGVREVIVENGRAVGARHRSGRDVPRRARSSPTSIRSCCIAQLIDAAALPRRFPRAHRVSWRCGSGTFRMNVALSELPDFTCLPGKTARRTSHRRHHHRADARLHGARLSSMRARTAGRSSRSSRC